MKNALVFALVFFGIVTAYSLMDYESEDLSVRSPASLPGNYEALSACEKQELLWSKVQESAYTDLPSYNKLGLPQLIKMARQELAKKGSYISDFAPQSWVKYLHRRGSMARVKVVPVVKKFTGVFEGAECALLRLSLTYKVTGGKPVAPGLALKFLRDGAPSANVSALVSLNGQGKDYNFFARPLSNIVPEGDGIGQALVHRMFRKVTGYPEELLIEHLASVTVSGEKVERVISPRQIFFVPASMLRFSSEEHDVREDFSLIPIGTTLYQIRALPEKYRDMSYAAYTPEMAENFVRESEHIADVITTSEFVASGFGDDGIFFRHELRSKAD